MAPCLRRTALSMIIGICLYRAATVEACGGGNSDGITGSVSNEVPDGPYVRCSVNAKPVCKLNSCGTDSQRPASTFSPQSSCENYASFFMCYNKPANTYACRLDIPGCPTSPDEESRYNPSVEYPTVDLCKADFAKAVYRCVNSTGRFCRPQTVADNQVVGCQAAYNEVTQPPNYLWADQPTCDAYKAYQRCYQKSDNSYTCAQDTVRCTASTQIRVSNSMSQTECGTAAPAKFVRCIQGDETAGYTTPVCRAGEFYADTPTVSSTPTTFSPLSQACKTAPAESAVPNRVFTSSDECSQFFTCRPCYVRDSVTPFYKITLGTNLVCGATGLLLTTAFTEGTTPTKTATENTCTSYYTAALVMPHVRCRISETQVICRPVPAGITSPLSGCSGTAAPAETQIQTGFTSLGQCSASLYRVSYCYNNVANLYDCVADNLLVPGACAITLKVFLSPDSLTAAQAACSVDTTVEWVRCGQTAGFTGVNCRPKSVSPNCLPNEQLLSGGPFKGLQACIDYKAKVFCHDFSIGNAANYLCVDDFICVTANKRKQLSTPEVVTSSSSPCTTWAPSAYVRCTFRTAPATGGSNCRPFEAGCIDSAMATIATKTVEKMLPEPTTMTSYGFKSYSFTSAADCVNFAPKISCYDTISVFTCIDDWDICGDPPAVAPALSKIQIPSNVIFTSATNCGNFKPLYLRCGEKPGVAPALTCQPYDATTLKTCEDVNKVTLASTASTKFLTKAECLAFSAMYSCYDPTTAPPVATYYTGFTCQNEFVGCTAPAVRIPATGLVTASTCGAAGAAALPALAENPQWMRCIVAASVGGTCACRPYDSKNLAACPSGETQQPSRMFDSFAACAAACVQGVHGCYNPAIPLTNALAGPIAIGCFMQDYTNCPPGQYQYPQLVPYFPTAVACNSYDKLRWQRCRQLNSHTTYSCRPLEINPSCTAVPGSTLCYDKCSSISAIVPANPQEENFPVNAVFSSLAQCAAWNPYVLCYDQMGNINYCMATSMAIGPIACIVPPTVVYNAATQPLDQYDSPTPCYQYIQSSVYIRCLSTVANSRECRPVTTCVPPEIQAPAATTYSSLSQCLDATAYVACYSWAHNNFTCRRDTEGCLDSVTNYESTALPKPAAPGVTQYFADLNSCNTAITANYISPALYTRCTVGTSTLVCRPTGLPNGGCAPALGAAGAETVGTTGLALSACIVPPATKSCYDEATNVWLCTTLPACPAPTLTDVTATVSVPACNFGVSGFRRCLQAGGTIACRPWVLSPAGCIAGETMLPATQTNLFPTLNSCESYKAWISCYDFKASFTQCQPDTVQCGPPTNLAQVPLDSYTTQDACIAGSLINYVRCVNVKTGVFSTCRPSSYGCYTGALGATNALAEQAGSSGNYISRDECMAVTKYYQCYKTAATPAASNCIADKTGCDTAGACSALDNLDPATCLSPTRVAGAATTDYVTNNFFVFETLASCQAVKWVKCLAAGVKKCRPFDGEIVIADGTYINTAQVHCTAAETRYPDTTKTFATFAECTAFA